MSPVRGGLLALAFAGALAIGIPSASATGGVGAPTGGGDSGSICSCGPWESLGCGLGGCANGKMYQTRACSPDGCSAASQCNASISCCTCVVQNAGCGSGGCAAGEMYQVKTCTPSGCRQGSTACVKSSVCDSDPNLVSSNWKPYGFALPGDPQYGFAFTKNTEQDFMGLAAKGNIVIGDYTANDFQTSVLPKLAPGPGSVTQPYAVDPTDAPIGYHTGSQGVMYDSRGRPLFDGDYTGQDGGTKLDGKPRRFYESTLADKAFQQLIDPTDPLFKRDGHVTFDGVFFTNHAVLGSVHAGAMNLNGSLVSRDEALVFREDLYLNHDSRLLQGSASELALPVSIKRPTLLSWTECPASGCP